MESTICNLFWYRSRENFAEYITNYLEGKIHFSSWRNVNDPMEGYFTYFPQKDTVKNLISEKNKYTICCFSKQFSNYLLWSHYAVDHKGVCLEYEFDTKLLPHNILLKEIKYVNKLPQYNSKLDIDRQAIKFLTSKLIFWQYEDETRLLLYNSSDSDISIDSIGKLKSITFGCQFFKEAIDNKNENLKCYKYRNRKSIFKKIREFKKNNSDFELYVINNINYNGYMTRTKTKWFDTPVAVTI